MNPEKIGLAKDSKTLLLNDGAVCAVARRIFGEPGVEAKNMRSRFVM
jgi:hypothetical protein